MRPELQIREWFMRLELMLTILAIAAGMFFLMTGRPQPVAAPRLATATRKRRIAPELTAAAAADRWYDEA
jgi:hypothetical protein